MLTKEEDRKRRQEIEKDARDLVRNRRNQRKAVFPALYDEDACTAEEKGEWRRAAVLWKAAAMASRGSDRKGRYYDAAERCYMKL